MDILNFSRKVVVYHYVCHFLQLFCITFTLYAIFNVLYTNKQKEYFFISNIEDVASSGYRSPSSILFQLDNNWIALVIKNEYPIKKKIENGHEVKISGYYKKRITFFCQDSWLYNILR